MSKTTIFLVILVGVAGLAVGIFTGFNPLTTIQNFAANPSSIFPWLTKAWQFIQQNIVGFITGFVGMFALAAKAYGNWKQSRQKLEQSLQTQMAQASTVNTQLTEKVGSLEAQLTEKTETFAEQFTKVSADFTELQHQNLELATTNKQLTDERNYFSNKVKELEAKLQETTLIK